MDELFSYTGKIKLLPCPFCGSVPEYVRLTQGTKWGCVSCCCEGPEVRTGYQDVEFWQEDAAEEWNTRASL